MKSLILIIAVFMPACVTAGGYRYNIYEDKQERVYNSEILKYNSYEGTWGYEQPNSTTQYNPYENKHEYKSEGDTLKYNQYENEWSYENKNSQLKYNPYGKKWEY